MKHLKKKLIKRLEKKGMEPGMIPGYIRSLSNSLHLKPYMTLLQVNDRLNYMGWRDFELDYSTFQLAVECLEAYGLTGSEYMPDNWFNNIFLNHTTQ